MAEKKNTVSKRLDSNRIKLRKGESQRKNGTYDYRWTTPDGKRHTIYATTLDELREKEEEIISDKRDGIRVENKRITVNDNGGQPNREEDYLSKSTVTGHYRFDASRIDEGILVKWG